MKVLIASLLIALSSVGYAQSTPTIGGPAVAVSAEQGEEIKEFWSNLIKLEDKKVVNRNTLNPNPNPNQHFQINPEMAQDIKGFWTKVRNRF